MPDPYLTPRPRQVGLPTYTAGSAQLNVPAPTPPPRSYPTPTPSPDEPPSRPYDPSATTGPYENLFHYLMPYGSNSFSYDDGDYYTEKMREHPAVVNTLQDAIATIAADCTASCTSSAGGKVRHSLGDNSLLGNILDYLSVGLGTLTGGLIGRDPAYGILGSLSSRSNWHVSSVDCAAGSAVLEIDLSNRMSAASNTRYSYSSPNATLLPENPFGENGPLGTVNQEWRWKEDVRFSPQGECPTLK